MNAPNSEMIIEVPVSLIRVSPFQPRRQFDQQELESLAKSIKSIGLIQPPVVREIKSHTKLLYYELIVGERRWRAAQLAGLSSIPVLLNSSSDILAAQTALIENLQRVDLSPIETAEALKKLIDTFGLTQEKLAGQVGKKRSTIANYLRLLSLSDDIKALLANNLLSLGHAKVILSIENTEIRSQLSQEVALKQLTVRQTELLAKQYLSSSVAPNSTPIHPEDSKHEATWLQQLTQIEQQLSSYLKCKVSLSKRDQQGIVSIHCCSEQDLLQLQKLLSLAHAHAS